MEEIPFTCYTGNINKMINRKLEVSYMADFIAEFIGGIIELITAPWIDKMNKKWKSRKKKSSRLRRTK